MSKNKPKILELYNFDESHAKYLENIHSSFKLKCKLCNQYISASIRVTSNWISHYKYLYGLFSFTYFLFQLLFLFWTF